MYGRRVIELPQHLIVAYCGARDPFVRLYYRHRLAPLQQSFEHYKIDGGIVTLYHDAPPSMDLETSDPLEMRAHVRWLVKKFDPDYPRR